MEKENILYIIAMEKEAIEIVKQLKLVRVMDEELYLYNRNNINLLISGIGKQRVAINVTKYLSKYQKPTIIINIGYSGSINCKIGSWVNVTKSYNYEWEIPGEEKYTIDEFNKDILIKLDSKELLQLPCYTAEKFVTKTDIKENVLFDMELHSIYVICCLYNIKLISLKKVSDNLSIKKYYENINMKQIMELSSALKYIQI